MVRRIRAVTILRKVQTPVQRKGLNCGASRSKPLRFGQMRTVAVTLASLKRRPATRSSKRWKDGRFVRACRTVCSDRRLFRTRRPICENSGIDSEICPYASAEQVESRCLLARGAFAWTVHKVSMLAGVIVEHGVTGLDTHAVTGHRSHCVHHTGLRATETAIRPRDGVAADDLQCRCVMPCPTCGVVRRGADD